MFIARRLPIEALLLSCGTFATPEEVRRDIELRGRVRQYRYDGEGRGPYLVRNGYWYPVVAGGSLGSALPARMAESTGTVVYVSTTGNDSTGNGTSGNPWRTIQKGIDNVSDGGIVEAAAGNYDEDLYWHGVAKANPTTVRGVAGGNARVSSLHWDLTGNHWRVRNLEVNANASPNWIGININDSSSSIEIDGCTIHNVRFESTLTPTPGVPTGGFNDEGSYIEGSAVRTNIQIWNTKFHDSGRCAVLSSQITLSGVGQTVTVDQNQGFAGPSSLWLPDRTKMSYTGKSGTTQFTGCTGAGTWPSGTRMYLVGGNSEPALADHGSYVSGSAGSNSPDILYANCLFYDNAAHGFQLWPNYTNLSNVWIVNCGAHYNYNGAGYMTSAGSADVTKKNRYSNCIAYKNCPDDTSNRVGQGFDTYFPNPNTIAANANIVDHCISNSNGDSSKPFAPNIANTFTVTNGLTGDPLFVDPANRNFHLMSGSPAIGVADPAYCPTTDLDGVTRG